MGVAWCERKRFGCGSRDRLVSDVCWLGLGWNRYIDVCPDKVLPLEEESGLLSSIPIGIQSYLVRYGDWRHCYVGARRAQSYLLRRYVDP